MKIYFSEVLKKATGISKEILQTSNSEMFKTEILKDEDENPYWDVEIKINGVNFEPVIFNSLFAETEAWVKYKAEEFMKDNLQSALDEADRRIKVLNDLNEQAISQLKEQFDLNEY